jgi:hypothetical protein
VGEKWGEVGEGGREEEGMGFEEERGRDGGRDERDVREEYRRRG